MGRQVVCRESLIISKGWGNLQHNSSRVMIKNYMRLQTLSLAIKSRGWKQKRQNHRSGTALREKKYFQELLFLLTKSGTYKTN